LTLDSYIPEEFVVSTGYQPNYVLMLLKHPLSKAPARKHQQRARHYSLTLQQALITCRRATNGICRKRLVPYLLGLLAVLERRGEIHTGLIPWNIEVFGVKR
jgi:hypothetical protein